MKAVLLTGGNLGDIDKSMVQARELIARRAGEIVAESKIYTSEAWGFESDNLFKNQVIIIDTPLSPLELLDTTQQIESELGRVRPVNKNGYTSRTMDIDILYIDNAIIRSRRLTIPHPLIQFREFVLNPLTEVAPKWENPSTGKNSEQMLAQLAENR
jgi:2-amino-4-hydroxy-6-hydroxymethyldihydropteridine diphosphokinase